ncbi:hypothetical protein OROHE_005650 [Orobanche hederae]
MKRSNDCERKNGGSEKVQSQSDWESAEGYWIQMDLDRTTSGSVIFGDSDEVGQSSGG